MTKRPVIFVVETGQQAGGVKVIGELANRLADHDWKVSIWSVNPRETLTSWFNLSPKVKWVSFFKTGTTTDYGPLADILKKQKAIKVATFWRTAFAVADASAPGEGYYLVQDIESSYVSQSLMIEMVLSTYQMPLARFTTSRWVEKNLPDTRYIGIGLENHWRPKPNIPKKPAVLVCARVQALKGWDLFCEVARYLATANIKVITYGHNKKLWSFAETEHHQFPSDTVLRRMYQECGVFLSQSRHEGFNLTLLEAMSCGAACVTTNSDGNLEYVQAGVNCILENDPLAIAKACHKLLVDRELANRLGAEAVKARAPYSWTEVIARLEPLLLEEPASPDPDSVKMEPEEPAIMA